MNRRVTINAAFRTHARLTRSVPAAIYSHMHSDWTGLGVGEARTTGNLNPTRRRQQVTRHQSPRHDIFNLTTSLQPELSVDFKTRTSSRLVEGSA